MKNNLIPRNSRKLGVISSTHKKVAQVFLIVGFILFVGVYANREEVVPFIWQKFHLFPELTVSLGQSAPLAVEIGNYYFNAGGEGVYDLKMAKKYFEKALELDPLVPDAWHQLARIDFLNGNFNSALLKINKQIELHRENHMASYYIRGLIHGYSGEFNEAVDDFLTFLKWDPINWAVYNDLAWIYFQAGDYKNTEVIAQYGLSYFPDNPWLLNIRGISLINLGDKEGARDVLGKALKEAGKLTVNDWKRAYPGNAPNIAEKGLAEMIEAIEFNLTLVGD